MADVPNADWSEVDASNSVMPPDGWPEGMFPSDVNNSARAMMGGLKRWYDRGNSTQTTTGTNTAYVLTYSSTQSALYDGFETSFILDQDNGAAATLNIDALGAKTLRRYDFVTKAFIALVGGEFFGNQALRVRYNLSADRYDIIAASQWSGSFVSISGNNTFTGDNTFTGKATFSDLIYASGSGLMPQGRVTLATGAPVMTGGVSGATTIYYTPYLGNLVPVYNGTQFGAVPFAELSNITTNSATGNAGPAAVAANKNYDMLFWSNAGVPTLTRSPAWSSDTARGTGAGTAELQRVNGLLTNKVAITNGPGANLGTYVGTVRSDGSSQINWILGAVAANGTAAVLGVWNAYNRVSVRGLIGDATDTWTYSTATARPANNSTAMRVSFVIGLQEDYISAEYSALQSNDTGGQGGYAGIGYDSTSAFSGRYPLMANPISVGNAIGPLPGRHEVQPIGFHYLQALEKSTGTGISTWYGDASGTVQTGLSYDGRF